MESASDPSTVYLVQPLSSFRNNNKACFLNPAFSLLSQTDTGIMRPGDATLWSDTAGWTLFLCFTPFEESGVGADGEVVDIVTPEINIRVFIDKAWSIGVRPRVEVSIPGGSGASITHGATLTVPLAGGLLPVIMCLRFGGSLNGNSLRVWVNGQQASNPGITCPVPAPSAYSRSDWCSDLQASTTATRSNISNAWGSVPMLNGIVSYGRALTQPELNDLTKLLSRMFFIDVDVPLLY